MTDVKDTPKKPIDPVVILQTGEDTYSLSLALDKLTCLDSASRALTVWLIKRKESETITIDIHNSSNPRYAGLESIITIVNAIHLCKAKTIANVAKIYDDISVYAILAADELVFTPYGMLQFLPKTPPLPDTPEAAAMSFAYDLLDQAEAKGYLSQMDVEFIKAGKTVMKYPS